MGFNAICLASCATLDPNLETRSKKERRGAVLVIQKKDGQKIEGELIAVIQNSLILSAKYSNNDFNINLQDVGLIRIVKESKEGRGFWVGFGIGAILQALNSRFNPAAEVGRDEILSRALVTGVIFGFIGMGMGSLAGIDETIQIEGSSPEKLPLIREKLRAKARFPSEG